MKLALTHLAPYMPYGLTGLWSNGISKEIEVIGNIYQHPHLPIP